MGHIREDLTEQEDRFWTVYDYLIVYRVDASPIEVVHVVSGRRDLEELLGSE